MLALGLSHAVPCAAVLLVALATLRRSPADRLASRTRRPRALSKPSSRPPPPKSPISRASRAPNRPRRHGRGAVHSRYPSAAFPGRSGRFRENRHGTVAFCAIFKRRIRGIWRSRRVSPGVCSASSCARGRRRVFLSRSRAACLVRPPGLVADVPALGGRGHLSIALVGVAEDASEPPLAFHRGSQTPRRRESVFDVEIQ